MSGSDDPIWQKLDQIATSQSDTRLLIEKMAGDQRAAHAEFNGKLNLVTQRLDGNERDNQSKIQALDDKTKVLRSDVDGLIRSKHYNAGRIAGISAGITALLAVVVEFIKQFIPH